MALSAYNGYLSADDLGVDYNECDAGMALFNGDYPEMIRLLKENPHDIPEVLSYLCDYLHALPAFAEAFPEHRGALKALLKTQIDDLKSKMPTDYQLAVYSLQYYLELWHGHAQTLQTLYDRL